MRIITRIEPWSIRGQTIPGEISGALRNYRQLYKYDRVGNISEMRHITIGGSWTRVYEYQADNNRLTDIDRADPGKSVHYDYDTHGSMLNLNREADEFHLRWDYRDMIHTVSLGGGGQAWYNYDTEKQRSRKRIERGEGTVEERLYLGAWSATVARRTVPLWRKSKRITCLSTISGC